MKKAFILITALLLLLLLCSSSFASSNNGNKTDQLAVDKALKYIFESKINLDRWEFVNMSEGFLVFFDKETVTVDTLDIFEVWDCKYFTGEKSCNDPDCRKNKNDTIAHSHYSRSRYNAKTFKRTLLSMMAKTKDGKTVFSWQVPSYLQKEIDIAPESVGEAMLKSVKEFLKNKKQ